MSNVNTDYRDISTNDYSDSTDLKCLVDWFEFTLPLKVPFHSVFSFIGIPKSEFSRLEGKKILGYSTVYVCGHIMVLTDGTVDMGHHVQMSGQGCREFELYNGCRWKELMSVIIDNEGKFSRLDIAIDDFKGYFKIPDLVEKIKDGELGSRFKRAKRIEDILISDGKTLGNTLYFGRGSSEIQIRMYEKNYEQEILDESFVWNRTEIQMRNKRAFNFALLYVNGDADIGEYARSVISNYLVFRDKDLSDSNKSRWPVSQFWIDFLGDVDKLKLTSKKPDRSMETIKSWLSNQVSKSLSMLAIVDPAELNRLVIDGQHKFSERDEILIDNYIKQREIAKESELLKFEQKKRESSFAQEDSLINSI